MIEKSQKGISTLWIIGIIVGMLLIGGIGISTLKPQSNTAPIQITEQESTEKPMVKPSEPQAKEEKAMMQKEESRYVTYSPSAFEAVDDKKRVLYFHAKWCPICQPIDKEFQDKEGQIPSDIVVFKTDYDTEKELKKKHAITYQHTFVQVDKDGNEVTKWNGGGLSEVIARVK